MRPRGRAVNGWDEMGPDPRKPLSFSLITVTQTSLHGTSTIVYLYFSVFFSCCLPLPPSYKRSNFRIMLGQAI